MPDIPLMHSPPSAFKEPVHLGNWRTAPFNRWAFTHVRELIPTAEIRGSGPLAWTPPVVSADLDDVRVPVQDVTMPLSEWLGHSYTDSMLVLHQGKIVYDYNRLAEEASKPHILMSVSKSLLGLVAGALIGRGVLDPDRPVSELIPDLRLGAYQSATVRSLLDMRVGVLFDEDDVGSHVVQSYRKAQGWDPGGFGCGGLRSFLAQLQPDRSHNGMFRYVSPNSDLLGWLIETVTGARFADVLSENLWRPSGAVGSAYITLDQYGAPRCAGGICATARDLAQIGLLVLNDGRSSDGGRAVPAQWINDIWSHSNPSAMNLTLQDVLPQQKVAYRSHWFVTAGATKVMFALGVYGQHLFVDKELGIVVVKLSSQPQAVDAEFIQQTVAAVQAISKRLTRQ